MRSAVSEPGRKPRSPILRSMGKEATHDTVTEESGKETRREQRVNKPSERRQLATSRPGAAIYTTVARRGETLPVETQWAHVNCDKTEQCSGERQAGRHVGLDVTQSVWLQKQGGENKQCGKRVTVCEIQQNQREAQLLFVLHIL